MLPLAESEQQEISAAFDDANAKLKEASIAVETLVKLLQDKCAFVSKTRIEQIRATCIPINASIFRLSVQRCMMMKFGKARALR